VENEYNLYCFTRNAPQIYFDYLGNASVGSMIKSMIAYGRNILSGTVSDIKGVSGLFVSAGIISNIPLWKKSATKTTQYKKSYRVKKKLTKVISLIGGGSYSVSAANCCVSVKGDEFLQLELKTPKLGFGFNLVFRGVVSSSVSYKYCIRDRDDEGWSGTTKVSFSGGVQAGVDLLVAEGQVEVGMGGALVYSHKTKTWSDLQTSTYVRAYYDLDLGIYEKRTEIKYTIGGDIDIF